MLFLVILKISTKFSSVRTWCPEDDSKGSHNHYKTIYEPVRIDRSSCRMIKKKGSRNYVVILITISDSTKNSRR